MIHNRSLSKRNFLNISYNKYIKENEEQQSPIVQKLFINSINFLENILLHCDEERTEQCNLNLR